MKVKIKKKVVIGIVMLASVFVILLYRNNEQEKSIKGQDIFSDDLKNRVEKISFWMNDQCYTISDKSKINDIFNIFSDVDLIKKSKNNREQLEGCYNLELYTEKKKISLDVYNSELIFDGMAYSTDRSVDKNIYQIFFGENPN